MLPSGLTREVLGARRRPEAPESQTAQLVGRSRSERLLDKLYNRQSRVLRDTERRRRQRKTVFLASEAKRRRENEVKPPSDIHAVKQTGDTKHQGSGASASSVASSNVSPTLRTDVVISNLVKHTSSPAKFPKVVRLSRQLVERAYSESDRGRFLHLFCALALNTTITSLPSESRGDAVAFGRALTEALCKSSQPLPFSLPNTDFLDDPAAHSDYLNETVPLNDWVAVLQLSVIWNNLLFTDDTYQFHTALSRFSSAFDALPYFSFYESFSSPTTLASLASSLLARHASAAVLSANASPVDCRISSSPAPSESGVSCDSFTLPNDQLCTAGQANGTSEASSPKEALQHFSHEPQSQQSDSDRGGDEENDDSQWLPTRCAHCRSCFYCGTCF